MVLFHYCSTETFFNILKHKSIWLSSLSASNDTLEGKWLSVVLRQLCAEFEVETHLTEDIASRFKLLEDGMDCLGLCLSEDGDMLSQWRGYSNDATGIAIGFNRALFDAMSKASDQSWPYTLRQVHYDESQQANLLRPHFGEMHTIVRAGAMPPTLVGWDRNRYSSHEEAVKAAEKNSLRLDAEIIKLINILFVTKNPAFAEEREWRFINEIDQNYPDAEFRVRRDTIVPFRSVPFPQDVNPIDSIIVGPRNPTPLPVIKAFLRSVGITCEIRRSKATYR